ncbi:hypothetical protein J4Q44_G00112370 [Coregonus suidteri]|uniref:Uncharacterized protein n=1 Tax=Coregonus suidteri TaxID=861788 RepID=A0AAN8QZD3_9TELE
MVTPPIRLPLLTVTSFTVQRMKNTPKVSYMPHLQLERQVGSFLDSKHPGPVKTNTKGNPSTSSHKQQLEVKTSRSQTPVGIPRRSKVHSTAAQAVAPSSGTPCRQSEVRIQAKPPQTSKIQDQRPRSPPAQARCSLSGGSLLQPPFSPVDVLQLELQARPKTGISRQYEHSYRQKIRLHHSHPSIKMDNLIKEHHSPNDPENKANDIDSAEIKIEIDEVRIEYTEQINTLEEEYLSDQPANQADSSDSSQEDSESDSEAFSCTQCEKSFRTALRLKKHQTRHTDKTLHYCMTCEKSFPYASLLKQHLTMHDADRTYCCTKCEKSFRSAPCLRKHLTTHGEKNHGCTECDRKFCSASRLKRHMTTHSGERPHVCTTCGKSFTRPESLKNHQLNHQGEKLHTCHDCGKSYSVLKFLKEHMKVHEGPHICSQCGKSYTLLYNLKMHMSAAHGEEKSLPCSECGKSFVSEYRLRKHQKQVHRTAFPCPECGRSFSTLSILQEHQSNHTGIKPHSCEECGKSFGLLEGLQRHQYTHRPKPEKSCLLRVPGILFQEDCDVNSCHPQLGDLMVGRAAKLSASSTCGLNGPQNYCILGYMEDEQKCFTCDSRQTYNLYNNQDSHQIENVITTFGTERKMKWWQSHNGGSQSRYFMLDIQPWVKNIM